MEHTKGPWQYTGFYVAANKGTDAICRMSPQEDGVINYAAKPASIEDHANGQLIASAPDLLAACILLRDELAAIHGHYLPKCDGGCPASKTITMADAAIAKAQGKQIAAEKNHLFDMTLEAAVDIAFELGHAGMKLVEEDSRANVRAIIQAAERFEKLHASTDWTEKDYLGAIGDFTTTLIKSGYSL